MSTPAYVQSTPWVQATSGVAFGINGVTAGSSILLIASLSGTGTFSGWTDSTGDTVYADVLDANIAISRVANTAHASLSFTPTFTGYAVSASFMEVSSLPAFDKAAAQTTAASVNFLTGALTPASNEAFLLAVGLTGGGSVTWTPTTGFTVDQTDTYPSRASMYYVQPTAALIDAAATLSGSETWYGVLVSYANAVASTPLMGQICL